MATTITRLLDGTIYEPYDRRTQIQVNPNAFGSSRGNQMALGPMGKSVPIASDFDPKSFSITVISGDESGAELQRLRRFLSSGELYDVQSPEFLLPTEWAFPGIWATVEDIEQTDYKSLTVTFTSYYGAEVTIEVQEVLYEHDFAQTDIPQDEFVFFNGYNLQAFGHDGFLRFTLESGPQAVWYPKLQIRGDIYLDTFELNQYETKKMNFFTGAQGVYGDWNLTQKRKSIVIDSTELVMGSGYFADQYNYRHQFFVVPNGTAVSGSLALLNNGDSYDGPWCTEDWKFKVEMITVGV